MASAKLEAERARREESKKAKGRKPSTPTTGGTQTGESGTFPGLPSSGTTSGSVPLPQAPPTLGDITLPAPFTTAVPPLREETPTSHAEATNEALYNAQTEAFRLANEEEKRGARAEDVVEAATQAANVPTLDENAIGLAFGQDVDATAPEFLGNMRSLRDYIGGAGITGGGAAQALATQFEMGRLGQVTDAKRSLFLEKAQTDTLDRVRNFQNQMALATQIQRPVAMQWSDQLQDLTGVRLAQEGLESAEDQAAISAKATKDAGKKSQTGSIIGGALGAIGGLLGGI